MSKVQMTQAQLEHIQDLERDYGFDATISMSWRSPENKFLNAMAEDEKAFALIAPEKVVIIQLEVTQ